MFIRASNRPTVTTDANRQETGVNLRITTAFNDTNTAGFTNEEIELRNFAGTASTGKAARKGRDQQSTKAQRLVGQSRRYDFRKGGFRR